MTNEDVRRIVVYVRSHQPGFRTEKQEFDSKVVDGAHFWCYLFDRRKQLLEGSREYDIAMDEIYITNAVRELSGT